MDMQGILERQPAQPGGRHRDRSPAAGRQQKPCVPRDGALLDALTIVAHDLRAPLANLSVLLELIEAYMAIAAHDRVRQSTRKAQATIATLDGLLRGFLERVRETGDPLAFRPALVDLADVITDVADLHRPLAESRAVAIRCAGLALATLGDRRLLAEAVGNLVDNAIKHAPAGSTVTIELVRGERGVTVRVLDEGPGIAPEQMARLFRPFASRKGRAGTEGAHGFGLWIVRLIVERHGGRIEVSPRDRGSGACFALTLPLHA
jgi:signal transduction histidine kinase